MIEILGDYKELEQALQENRITQDEHDRIFTESRIHSLRGDIEPFAIGGSDLAGALGRSKYTTPERLVLSKLYPDSYREPVYGELQYRFLRGHLFEEPIAKMGASILAKRIGRPVTFVPCTQQFRNERWPNIVANVDGFYDIGGKRYVCEVKCLSFRGENAELFKQGIVPEDYIYQGKCYCQVLDVEGVYYVACTGIMREDDFSIVFVPSSKEDAKYLDEAQALVDNVSLGIMPDNSDYALRREALEKDRNIRFARLDPEIKPVRLNENTKARFEKLKEFEQVLAPKKAEFDAIKKKYKSEIQTLEKEMKEATKALTSEIEKLDQEILDLKTTFLPEVGNGKEGYYRDPDTHTEYVVTVDRDFSMTQKEKKHLSELYPDVYNELATWAPKFTYKISAHEYMD